jgi:hypothetical protein
MAPILNESEPRKEGGGRVQSAASLASTWRTFLAWRSANNLVSMFSSRPIRSVLASLVFVVAGVSLSVPLWRIALAPDSGSVDSNSNQPSRGVRDAPDQQPLGPSTGGESVYLAQLVKSLSFSRTTEALDRINARYPTVFRERSLVIRRANSGDEPSAYIGGVGGLRSARDAEQICSQVRAGGDPCDVVNVPNE